MELVTEAAAGSLVGYNKVELVGVLKAPAELRTLPSGDEVATFRVTVPRPATSRSSRRLDPDAASRRRVDAIECAAWTPRLRKAVLRLPVDRPVRVEGMLQRRWWRSPAGSASRLEVEVTAVRPT